MYCSKCGYELKNDGIFCLKCGSKNTNNSFIDTKKYSTFDIVTNSKEINPRQSKIKNYIILVVLVVIVLLSVGFGSYYISLSKFLLEDSKNLGKTSTRNKIILSDNTTKNNSNIKPDVTAPANNTAINKMVSNDHYIFAKSGSEKLLDSDVSKLTKQNLALARNEIFARHGFVFKTEEFKTYFNNKPWYTPNPSFNDSNKQLNAIESYNVQLILKCETN